jgi:DNA mismatch endonuclease (patch repair protein)
MTDKLTKNARSALMSRVRNKHTAPEVAVRKALHAAGFRFRLHRRDLPGRPDISLPKYRLAVFVHGCFWHGHDCRRGRLPTSNTQFWEEKIGRNRERDRLSGHALAALGWSSTTIWGCRIQADTKVLIDRLNHLRDRTSPAS